MKNMEFKNQVNVATHNEDEAEISEKKRIVKNSNEKAGDQIKLPMALLDLVIEKEQCEQDILTAKTAQDLGKAKERLTEVMSKLDDLIESNESMKVAYREYKGNKVSRDQISNPKNPSLN